MTDRYIVMQASQKMPSSCWGHYRKVAVVETIDGTKPAMISDRAKGIVRIVKSWEKLYAGGPRSAFQMALREAERLARKLNREDKP